MVTDIVDTILTRRCRTHWGEPGSPLADGLKQLIDIGINVESGPGMQSVQSNPDFLFITALAKTPTRRRLSWRTRLIRER